MKSAPTTNRSESAPSSAHFTPIEPRPNTQAGRLLAELKSGRAVDPLTAWIRLGIYRLSDVIFQLRKAGWCIQTEIRPVQNRFGEECRVGYYSLTEEAENV